MHSPLLSRRTLGALLLCATALAGAAAEQPAPEGITDATIAIGVEAAVGSLSLDGENQGFRLAFEEANARGGVHGRRFVWGDRRRRSGEPADVLAVARQMIDDDRVFALVNFSGPAIGDIVAYARSQRVPVMFPHTALVSSEGERYLFTSFPRFEGEAAVMFRYLSKDRKFTRLAIAHDPNAYGLTFRDRLTAHAAEFGYEVAGAVPITSRKPTDLSAEFAALVATRPDAIVMAIYPEQAQALMAARARAGWRGRMVSAGPLTDEASLDRAWRRRRWHARLLPLSGPGTEPGAGRRALPGRARAHLPGPSGRSLHALRLHVRPAGRGGRRARGEGADARALHRRDGGHRRTGTRAACCRT